MVQLLWSSQGGFEYLQGEFYNLGDGYAKWLIKIKFPIIVIKEATPKYSHRPTEIC